MTLGRCAVLVAAVLLAVTMLPACSQTANITEVWMALDEEGHRRRNEFFTDSKEIHCVATAGIGREGVTVEGFIRQQQAYDFATNAYVPIDRILAYTEFSPDRSEEPVTIDLQLTTEAGEGGGEDPPFVAGRYQCEILLDGALEGTAVFNIEFPPCPPAAIIAGTRCFGFYRENDECPAFGATGAPTPTCRCSQAEGWRCN